MLYIIVKPIGVYHIMKLTESQLRNIIKQELKKVIKESDGYEVFKKGSPPDIQLSNEEYAVLYAVSLEGEAGDDITYPVIADWYRTVSRKSNGMLKPTGFDVRGKTPDFLKDIVNTLIEKGVLAGSPEGFYTTNDGDMILTSNRNQAVEALF